MRGAPRCTYRPLQSACWRIRRHRAAVTLLVTHMHDYDRLIATATNSGPSSGESLSALWIRALSRSQAASIAVTASLIIVPIGRGCTTSTRPARCKITERTYLHGTYAATSTSY